MQEARQNQIHVYHEFTRQLVGSLQTPENLLPETRAVEFVELPQMV